jgi:hypothetical protein
VALRNTGLYHKKIVLQRPPAELKCSADWQISTASAKIVSGFLLETNGTRLGWRASTEGRGHLNFKYAARLHATA